MPEPAVVEAMRQWKAGLLAEETSHMQVMARRWVTVEEALQGNIETLTYRMAEAKDAGQAVSESSLFRMDRYQRLVTQAQAEFERYADWAEDNITRQQSKMVGWSLEHAATAIDLTMDYHGVRVGFSRLPVEAATNIIGLAGDGKAVGDLLRRRMVRDENGLPLPGVAERLRRSLIDGTALGYNPRKTARMMRDDLAGGLQKALVIARSETMRPYRETTRAAYERSGVVESQQRISAHDERVCAACIADDGAIYSLRYIISDHPQGRCTSIPVLRNLPPVQWQAGESWFLTQDEGVQRAILGTDRLAAYQEGIFNFDQLVRRTSDPVWGAGLTPAPLKDLVPEGWAPEVN